MQKYLSQKQQKLGEFLLKSYNGKLSYGRLNKLFRQKDIKVNGKRVNADMEIFSGDIIECYFDGESKPLEVIFADENVVVCNKPTKITAEDFYKEVVKSYPTAIFTHRLDRNTFGVMIFALNQKAYEELFFGFKERTFEKYYYCLVYGAFEKKNGSLNDYLFKDAKKGLVTVSSQKTKGSLPICTKYKEVACGEQTSVLKVELVTGRTHQIRAHLAHYGHFIIGDGKYGDERVNKTFKQSGQLLVAGELVLHFNSENMLFYLNNKSFCVDNLQVFKKLK